MHNITIFAFLHFVLIYLFKWHKVFLCAGNFVPLSCRKNEVDAIFKKKIKNDHKHS